VLRYRDEAVQVTRRTLFESRTLQIGLLVVWGLKDIFFELKWAYWLRDTIPGARRVVEVEDARLFFPEDRPDELARSILEFWDELSMA
jgi:pimeloyl-ACP methyl ester carboxylesterase